MDVTQHLSSETMERNETYLNVLSSCLQHFNISPNGSASIQDGMVMVNMLVPDKDKQKTFGD